MMKDGTAIGTALAASVNRLRAEPAKSKLVVLLTDGQNNAGCDSTRARRRSRARARREGVHRWRG